MATSREKWNGSLCLGIAALILAGCKLQSGEADVKATFGNPVDPIVAMVDQKNLDPNEAPYDLGDEFQGTSGPSFALQGGPENNPDLNLDANTLALVANTFEQFAPPNPEQQGNGLTAVNEPPLFVEALAAEVIVAEILRKGQSLVQSMEQSVAGAPGQGPVDGMGGGPRDGLALAETKDNTGMPGQTIPGSSVGATGGTTDLAAVQQGIREIRVILDRISVSAGRIQGTSQVTQGLRTEPQHAPCVIDGGIAVGTSCQCRGWGVNVEGYVWEAPTVSQVASTAFLSELATGASRRCPRLESRYCHVWPTRSGRCGIFEKKADWRVEAFRITDKQGGEAECDRTFDLMVQQFKDVVFGQYACDEHIAALNRKTGTPTVQVRRYDKATGQRNNNDGPGQLPAEGAVAAADPLPNSIAEIRRLCEQISTSGSTAWPARSPVAWQPGAGASRWPPTGRTPTPSPTPTLVAGSVINTGGTRRATWVTSPNGLGACQCGTRTMELQEIMGTETRSNFEKQCRSTL